MTGIANPELDGHIGQINLSYGDGNIFHPLPQWAKFYIELGQKLGQLTSADARYVVALAIPTRTFCATLLSLGYIAVKLCVSDQSDYMLYAEYLKTLPVDTPVILRIKTGKKFKGLFKGHCQRGNQLFFRIKTDKRNSTEYFIKEADSKSIEALDISGEFNLPEFQKGRSRSQRSNFSSALLGNTCANRLVSSTNFEEVIIGPKSLLKTEISEEVFATKNRTTGTLQEILRAKNYQNPTAVYRSIIISDRIKSEPDHSKIQDPPLVIFDGGQGFLKWRSFWKESSWVIILDRTENQFEPAIEQVNREYIQNRVGNPINTIPENIPEGIEILAFQVKL
jgi:hypothetical protein